ncbi:Cytochrome P450 monooxygenase aneF [Dirofilaria immitis]
METPYRDSKKFCCRSDYSYAGNYLGFATTIWTETHDHRHSAMKTLSPSFILFSSKEKCYANQCELMNLRNHCQPRVTKRSLMCRSIKLLYT